ncbi:MAG: sulfite exporter TauE/SafE family protein, partial [Bacteroidales bacterium]|nr:sulfite exporter TauE/SafE family protein [Bacteroidales bacterium]
AQGTSLAFMLAPVGIFAFINYYKAGYVNVKYAIIIAVAFMVGSYFSSKWAVQMNTDTLKKVFGALIILVGIKMLLGK